MDTQVIVVGAGPVGLLLAGELRLGGADVTVVERLARPTTESRASTLHARTMEVLDQRGLLERLGARPREPKGHFGGIPLDFSALPSPYAGLWKVPQTRLEPLLEEWVRDLGAVVLRGCELTGMTAVGDAVEAELAAEQGSSRIRSAFLVGCDGERSTVRRLARFDFPGRPAGREMLRCDVAGVDIPDRRFERLPGGLAVAGRLPGGVTRVMVHRFGARPARRVGEPEFAEVVKEWATVTGEDIGAGTPLWVNAFDDTARQAARYRQGRILLAGDAAHVQMPVGGQALNLGLQDVVNLGWKLAAELRGDAADGLLDTYHSERHAVGRRVLANIGAQALVLLGAQEVRPVRELLAELMELDSVRGHLASMVSGLDVRYDTGSGQDPLLGLRMPPTGLRTRAGRTDTARLLHPAHGVLLDLGAGRWAKAADRWADRVDAVVAEPVAATTGTPSVDAGAVLLRPDGHVVWTDADGTSVEEALRRWFGVPLSR
ncbi:FAD-dependent monooxygenase [Streptomyces sp. NPDC059063]|uniref:FAD-dependent monooxygenase n=1 Tax=unclassified Streptomyces TaxID=2593676 RepID=UPI003697BDF6